MKYLIVKDKKRRLNSVKYELKGVLSKALAAEAYAFDFIDYYKDKILKPNFIFFCKISGLFFFHPNKGKFSKIKVKNRCTISGRGKSILRYYKVSRICFRELVSSGKFVGVYKSSW